MLATAADSLGDVITTSATVVSILICYVANVNIDAIAGLIVSLLVIWSGFSIAKRHTGAADRTEGSGRIVSENFTDGRIL